MVGNSLFREIFAAHHRQGINLPLHSEIWIDFEKLAVRIDFGGDGEIRSSSPTPTRTRPLRPITERSQFGTAGPVFSNLCYCELKKEPYLWYGSFLIGGDGEIRTLELVSELHDFQSCALDRTRRHLPMCDYDIIQDNF